MSDLRGDLEAAGVVGDDAKALELLVAGAAAGVLDRDEVLATRREELVLQVALVASRDFRRFGTALRAMLEWLEAATAAMSAYDVGRFWHLRGLTAWRLDDSSFMATRALNLASAFLTEDATPRADRYRARVHDTLGQMLVNQGLLTEGREELEHALDLRDPVEDLEGRAITLGNLGRLCMDLGDYVAAIQHLDEDLTIVGKLAPTAPIRTQLVTHLATANLRIGKLVTARELFDTAVEYARAGGDPIGEAFAELGLAQLALQGLEPDTARTLGLVDKIIAQVAAPAYERFRQQLLAIAFKARAEAHARRGEHALAIDAYRSALVALDKGSALIEYAEVLRGLSATLATFGERGEAVTRLREALNKLDGTAATTLRSAIEQELRASDKDAWFAHTAGRFVGQRNSARMIEEAGLEGFRGERARRTILFSDLRGFTTLSERLEADVLIVLLNDYLTLMTRCVTKHGGTIDKFIGDAVMAVFQDATADAQAVATAIAMRDELERFNRGRKVARDAVLSIGIGVHSGEVIAGLIGSPSKREYTVIGDPVNTASRLEGMTKLLGATVLASATVVAAIDRDRYLVRPLGLYAPKGRRSNIAVFDIMGERDRSPASRAILDEIARCETALAAFASGAFGEAGTLFAALSDAAPLARKPGYRLLAKRAAALLAEPPSTEWAGEIVLDEK